MSNNNYHPKSNVVENGVFPVLGSWQLVFMRSKAYYGVANGHWSPGNSVSIENLKRQDCYPGD